MSCGLSHAFGRQQTQYKAQCRSLSKYACTQRECSHCGGNSTKVNEARKARTWLPSTRAAFCVRKWTRDTVARQNLLPSALLRVDQGHTDSRYNRGAETHVNSVLLRSVRAPIQTDVLNYQSGYNNAARGRYYYCVFSIRAAAGCCRRQSLPASHRHPAGLLISTSDGRGTKHHPAAVAAA